MDESRSNSAERHGVPAIDRMMQILEFLERRPQGASLGEMLRSIGRPPSRSSVYRLLNSLVAHGMVANDVRGVYRLGPRLHALSSNIVIDTTGYDLRALADPHLVRLAQSCGESARLSVVDQNQTLVLTSARANSEFSLTAPAGQRLPLHAGAGSKILLGSLGADARKLAMTDLPRFTDKTICSPALLQEELALIQKRGWSFDPGEYSINVNSYGAPVKDRHGKIIAAISVAFLAGKSNEESRRIRNLVIAAAETLGSELAMAVSPDAKPTS